MGKKKHIILSEIATASLSPSQAGKVPVYNSATNDFDLGAGGGGISEAPNDGKLYGRMNENWEEILSVDTSRYIISGFPIWSGTGLTYNYPQISYVWNGAELTASQGSVTLDTADVSFDRFDLIVLSEDGTVSVIKGTASYNPIIPTLPNDKLLLLTINVKAGMTEPNIISEIIYNENIEWATSILLKNHPNIPDDLGTIDFNNTNEFKVGAKSIHWNTNEKKVAVFKPTSLVNPTDWTALSMWVMLKEPINDGRRFEFRFYKTAGNAIGNYIDIRTKGLNSSWSSPSSAFYRRSPCRTSSILRLRRKRAPATATSARSAAGSTWSGRTTW